MTPFSALTNRSGGIGYHLRAWRYRQTLWEPFRLHLNTWLDQWPTHDKALIVIGPSAGYCFEPRFFEKFSQIIAVDVDPLAHWLFKSRFRQCKITWIGKNVFVSLGKVSVDGFAHLLNEYPRAQILFANFLGQLPFAFNSHAADLEAFKADLLSACAHRNWASFHDRLSWQKSTGTAKIESLSGDNLENRELARQFWESQKLNVLDHQTENLAPQKNKIWLHWQITPHSAHIIEGVTSES